MPVQPVATCRLRLFKLFGACSLLMSTPALSGETYFFGLHTVPATPVAGQAFTLRLRAMTCHVFWSEGPLDRTVEVFGSTVRVTVEYTAPAFGGGCDPDSLRTVDWSIGPLPAGSYTLEFAGDDPIGGGVHEIEYMPITVVPPVASLPSVVPVNGTWALLLLGLSCTALAWSALRLRQ